MSTWLQSVDLTQLLLIAHQMPLVQSTALVSFTGGCLCWTLQVWKIHLWSPLSKDFSAHTWHLRAVCFRRTWQWDGMLPLSCSGKLSAGCLTWPRGTYEKGPSECKAEKKLKNFWDPGKLHNSSIFRLKGKKKRHHIGLIIVLFLMMCKSPKVLFFTPKERILFTFYVISIHIAFMGAKEKAIKVWFPPWTWIKGISRKVKRKKDLEMFFWQGEKLAPWSMARIGAPTLHLSTLPRWVVHMQSRPFLYKIIICSILRGWSGNILAVCPSVFRIQCGGLSRNFVGPLCVELGLHWGHLWEDHFLFLFPLLLLNMGALHAALHLMYTCWGCSQAHQLSSSLVRKAPAAGNHSDCPLT